MVLRYGDDDDDNGGSGDGDEGDDDGVGARLWYVGEANPVLNLLAPAQNHPTHPTSTYVMC